MVLKIAFHPFKNPLQY